MTDSNPMVRMTDSNPMDLNSKCCLQYDFKPLMLFSSEF